MDWDTFGRLAKEAADWARPYHAGLRDRPVRAQTRPGATFGLLADAPPEHGEPPERIVADFHAQIVPGLTHWQHPRFFAYFNANAAPASALAELYTAIIAPQCMLWQTSPAATEMELRMVQWMASALGLPADFGGVIQDSASSATLAAVLTMRERALAGAGNRHGLPGQAALRIYCSDQVHSSVDRAIWVAGIGQDNLVKLPGAGALRAMQPAALADAIARDRAAGRLPAGVIMATGATGMGACDPVGDIAQIARSEGLYTHLDAAWAGSAMICPEYRTLWDGAGLCDSIAVNPHKWLGAHFDCALQFLRDPDQQRRALAIRPSYLETSGDAHPPDLSELTVPLGRRFRALKLWFLLRSYGLEGLRTRIRNHVAWSQALCARLGATPGFEIVTQPVLSLWTFRRSGASDAQTAKLTERINADGRIYLTSTRLDGQVVIRFQAGQFDCTEADFDVAYDAITQAAVDLTP